jgi:glucose-1-phosphate thymidylyltransferase
VEGLLGRPDARAPVGPDLDRALLRIDSSAARDDSGLHTLSVANRPVILRVLESFAEAGVREVAVAVEAPLAPPVRDVLDSCRTWPFEVSYLDCPAEGMLEAVRLAGQPSLSSPLLVHWACGLFKAPLGSLLGGGTVGPLDAVLLVEPRQAEGPVVDLASERLGALMNHPGAPSAGGLTGVALLGVAAPEVGRRLPPGAGSDLELLALVERMVQLGGRVRARPAVSSWRFTGAVDSALELNRFLLSDLRAAPPELESAEATLQGPVHIDPSATLERSTVRGPVVIGARTRLIDSWIGPYTSIGDDVCVEGAEIENSILLDDTRITHLDRRLEASVVGPGATICRDFRLPRALRLHVGDGARVSLT